MLVRLTEYSISEYKLTIPLNTFNTIVHTTLPTWGLPIVHYGSRLPPLDTHERASDNARNLVIGNAGRDGSGHSAFLIHRR